MARGNDPGRDFDNQWNESRRKGQEKAARGETHWATDKYLERVNAERSHERGRHAGEPKGCADKAALLVGLLGGFGLTGWALAEAVSRGL